MTCLEPAALWSNEYVWNCEQRMASAALALHQSVRWSMGATIHNASCHQCSSMFVCVLSNHDLASQAILRVCWLTSLQYELQQALPLLKCNNMHHLLITIGAY